MFFEACHDIVPILLKDLVVIGKMFTFLQHFCGILERIEEELEAFAGVGVLLFPFEYAWKYLPTTVQIITSLVFLYKHMVVCKNFQLVKKMVDLHKLFLLDKLFALDEIQTIFYDGDL
jgi:hypothetical protein